MKDDSCSEKPVIKLAVRMLAETVYRQGGLAGNSFGSDAIEGIRLHQFYTASMQEKYGERIESEKTLNADYVSDNFMLQISGRCDLIILGKISIPSENNDNISDFQDDSNIEQSNRYTDEIDTIAEIKTHSLKPHQLPSGGDPLHWAQLMIYAWMYMLRKDALTENLQLEIIYLSSEDRSRQFWRRIVSRQELQKFFNDSCKKYLNVAGNWINWQKMRDNSARNITFPYESIRFGQKEMMKDVLAAVKQNSILFAQAPTGIGKTMSAIFPSVRALGHHLVDYVFYLTAMTSTRQAAIAALDDLRKSGLHIRSIELKAKEKICLEPELYCDTTKCPYATMYYTNLPDALTALFSLEKITEEAITALARKFQVCPFELSLDVSLYCDFIICDYNYAFDPRVKLDRFFGQQPRSSMLLVDEAHNLPARSREMYSARINEKQINNVIASLDLLMPPKENQNRNSTDDIKPLELQIKTQYHGDIRTPIYLKNCLMQLKNWFNLLRPQLTTDSPDAGFELAEKACKEQESMKASGFLGMRRKPDSLLAAASRCRHFLSLFIDEASELEDKSIYKELMFEIAFFSRISDLFERGCHITSLKKSDADTNNLTVELLCLDSAPFITDTYYLKRPVIFFSATLTPISYYIGLLNSKATENPPEQLCLASPFPAENLMLMLHTKISVRYKDRDQTMPELIDLVLEVISQKTGNYLLFVPSYAYLQKFRKLMKAVKPEEIDCLMQIPNMDEALKKKFLGRFDHHGDKTLLAVAVMGSFFNEGIDLAGERLSGVIITGTGMPVISPEREILRQYYDAGSGSGFAYSYVYPGFNRVQQAAGRVIRSENDRGFVLLIDDRYNQYEYRQLFPHEWQPLDLDSKEEICEALHDFWQ